jgi:hypothetical protein
MQSYLLVTMSTDTDPKIPYLFKPYLLVTMATDYTALKNESSPKEFFFS